MIYLAEQETKNKTQSVSSEKFNLNLGFEMETIEDGGLGID